MLAGPAGHQSSPSTTTSWSTYSAPMLRTSPIRLLWQVTWRPLTVSGIGRGQPHAVADDALEDCGSAKRVLQEPVAGGELVDVLGVAQPVGDHAGGDDDRVVERELLVVDALEAALDGERRAPLVAEEGESRLAPEPGEEVRPRRPPRRSGAGSRRSPARSSRSPSARRSSRRSAGRSAQHDLRGHGRFLLDQVGGAFGDRRRSRCGSCRRARPA